MAPDPAYARRVGMALAAVRDYAGHSQSELAALAGVSDSTISRYEEGRVQAHAETMVRIARALDVPLELLLDPPATRQQVFEALAFHRASQRAGAPEPS